MLSINFDQELLTPLLRVLRNYNSGATNLGRNPRGKVRDRIYKDRKRGDSEGFTQVVLKEL